MFEVWPKSIHLGLIAILTAWLAFISPVNCEIHGLLLNTSPTVHHHEHDMAATSEASTEADAPMWNHHLSPTTTMLISIMPVVLRSGFRLAVPDHPVALLFSAMLLPAEPDLSRVTPPPRIEILKRNFDF